MARRIQKTYWDITNKVFRNATGAVLDKDALKPYINKNEHPLMNVLLVIDENLTPVTDLVAESSAGSITYNIAIDSDWNEATAPMCRTTVGINTAGEWYIGEDDSAWTGNADLTVGELSFILDAETIEYSDKIGTTAEESNCKLEIQIIEDGVLVFVTQMPIRALNLIDPDGGASVTPIGLTSGAYSIPDATRDITITGAALGWTPTGVLASVTKPLSTDPDLFIGSPYDITSDGFKIRLSATTSKAGYTLSYVYLG